MVVQGGGSVSCERVTPVLNRRGATRILKGETGGVRVRVPYLQPTGPNPLDNRDDLSGPAVRLGSLNSRFRVALYLPPPGSRRRRCITN